MALKSNGTHKDTILLAFIGSLLVISCLPEVSCSDTGCPDGNWSWYAGNCYTSFSDLLTWQKSETACKNYGGHLYSAYNQSEEDFLLSSVLTSAQESDQFWIGLSDTELEGVYIWSDSSAVDFTNFDAVDDKDNNTCVYLQKSGTTSLWYKVNCTSQLQSICESKATEVTPTVTPPPQTTRKDAPSVSYCPSTWIQVEQSCFQVFGRAENSRKNWTDAILSCKSMNASLATIHSQAEQSLIVSELLLAGSANVWIALYSDDGATFQWEDGSPLDYVKWAQNQPDGDPDFNRCVELLNNIDEAGRWNDDDCNYLGGYACEMPIDESYFHTEGPGFSICERPTFEPYRQSCFYIDPVPVDYNTAITVCDDLVSSLTTVIDGFEEAFLESMIFQKGLDSVWIGLNDKEDEGIYKWVDTWPVWYTNWGHSEPSRGEEEGCVAMMSDGSWNDTMCSETKPPICKFTFNPVPTDPPAVEGNCSSGWFDYGSYCYMVQLAGDDGYTWEQASDECQLSGAELVSIHTKYENEFVEELVRTQASSDDFLWIGLYRNDEDGFSWTDFSPVEYDYWGTREPASGLGDHDCGMFLSTFGQWSVENCIKTEGYICKTLKVPATTPRPSTTTVTTTATTSTVTSSQSTPSQASGLMTTKRTTTMESTVTFMVPPDIAKDTMSTGAIIGICFGVLIFICGTVIILILSVRGHISFPKLRGDYTDADASITNAVFVYDSGGDKMRVDDEASII